MQLEPHPLDASLDGGLESSLEDALALGATASTPHLQGVVPSHSRWPRLVAAPQPSAPPTTSLKSTLHVRRLVRGQSVVFSGTVVVVGDVPAGAAVSAGGDVIVLGRALGRLEAGMGEGGDKGARVFAAYMAPSHLAIAGLKVVRTPTTQQWFGRIYSQYAAVASAPDGGECIRVAHTALPPARAHMRPAPAASALASLSSAGRASLFTGLYIAAAGLCLLFAPRATFSLLFDPAYLASQWVRVFGVLCAVFGEPAPPPRRRPPRRRAGR